MRSEKPNRLVGYKLMLTAILLLVCVLLLVGAAWARYQANEVNYLGYAPKGSDSISLQANGGWLFSGEYGTLSFSVSNSEDGVEYPQGDQYVSVRLLASLSIAEIDGADVYLTVSDGEQRTVYAATPASIPEGSALHKTFGDGKAYMFYDGDKELSWTLAGGTVSTFSAELEIIGLEQPQNPALLQLQVVGG